MTTIRENQLIKSLNEIRTKQTISLNEFDKFLADIDKVLSELKRRTEQRDLWKNKFMNLKNTYSGLPIKLKVSPIEKSCVNKEAMH